ncbi:MAG: hypothetical protein AAF725_22055, partial [Acidobacteriota bacterium]
SELRRVAGEHSLTDGEHRQSADEVSQTPWELTQAPGETRWTPAEHRRGDLTLPPPPEEPPSPPTLSRHRSRTRRRFARTLKRDLRSGGSSLARAGVFKEILGPPPGLEMPGGSEKGDSEPTR